jgi:hypothetical protein
MNPSKVVELSSIGTPAFYSLAFPSTSSRKSSINSLITGLQNGTFGVRMQSDSSQVAILSELIGVLNVVNERRVR